MGILDDAIREHLDLKRRHGAEDDEVQVLEDEVFGPPSRPGEPDFPERPPTGEHATGEVPEEAPSEEPAEAPREEAEEGGFFDQASEASSVHQPTVEHPAPTEEPAAEAPAPPAPPEPAPEPEPVPEPVPPPVPEPEPDPTPEPPPPAAAESAGDDFEIGEIELDIDEEFEEFAEPDEATDTGPPDAEAEDGPDAEAAVEPEEADDEAAEPEGETLLEETPEFLRDTPEDERLWFEQGKPKDFDFEDDDDAEGSRD